MGPGSYNIFNETIPVYPNPTMSATQVNIPYGMSLEQIIISDIYGRTVRRLVSGNSINLSGLRKGTYTVQMIKASGERTTTKLLVN